MDIQDCFTTTSSQPIPLVPVNAEQFGIWLEGQSDSIKGWVNSHRFTAKANSCCVIPSAQGGVDCVLYGAPAGAGVWTLGAAASLLPEGDYELVEDWNDAERELALLGFALGSYQFDRYVDKPSQRVRMLINFGADALRAQVQATALVRDLINTPPEDLMPQDLAIATSELAAEFGGEFTQIIGDQLLLENYPTIHAVGRASIHAPRLLELTWGNPEHPRIALVGKGVCFDSGGLDMKPSAGMRYMQKDMGGAAHVLGLAYLIMANELPVSLHVLVPAVENAVSSNAFHPGDILQTRSGLTVEIENTDAEGRLVLCDAITEAVSHNPELVIDFATLTGAARVAVGTDIACYFSNDDVLSQAVDATAAEVGDPVWRLPLHAEYASMLKSNFADLMNASKTPYGGAITAALFLQRFIKSDTDWMHFDVMAWNTGSKPGRPEGGEALGLRAVFQMLQARYGGSAE